MQELEEGAVCRPSGSYRGLLTAKAYGQKKEGHQHRDQFGQDESVFLFTRTTRARSVATPATLASGCLEAAARNSKDSWILAPWHKTVGRFGE
jgi:hypothetical protein